MLAEQQNVTVNKIYLSKRTENQINFEMQSALLYICFQNILYDYKEQKGLQQYLQQWLRCY